MSLLRTDGTADALFAALGPPGRLPGARPRAIAAPFHVRVRSAADLRAAVSG